MRADTRRYLVVIALLALGLVLARRAPWPRSPGDPVTGAATPAAPSPAEYTYFVDVEGWYRITPRKPWCAAPTT
jgi:hypothetical protein